MKFTCMELDSLVCGLVFNGIHLELPDSLQLKKLICIKGNYLCKKGI